MEMPVEPFVGCLRKITGGYDRKVARYIHSESSSDCGVSVGRTDLLKEVGRHRYER